MEPKKYSKVVSKTKKKQTHRYTEQASGYQWGQGSREGKIGVGDFKKRIIMGLYEIMFVNLENCKAL